MDEPPTESAAAPTPHVRLPLRRGISVRFRAAGPLAVALLLIARALPLPAADAPPPQPDPAATAPVLRVGTASDSFPYSSLDARGRLEGFTVELLQAMARATGVKLELRPVASIKWAEGFAAGDYDAHALLIRSPERMKTLDFSQPYLRLTGAVFVRDDTPPVQSIKDLRSRKLVVHRTSAGREFLTQYGIAFDGETANNVTETLHLVADGRFDATLAARLTALSIMRRDGIENVVASGPPLQGYEITYAFAVRRGDEARLALLNEGLALVNRNGDYDRIYERWFGRFDAPRITREQIAVLVAAVLAVFLALAVWAWRRQNFLRTQLAGETRRLEDVAERAGCVLWSAHIAEVGGGLQWGFEELRGNLRMLGLATPEGAARPSEILYTRENTPDYDTMNVRATTAVHERAAGYEQEFRLQRDGRTVWLAERVSLTPIETARWHAAGVIIDITRLKAAETEVRRLNETLELRVHARTAELEAALRELENFAYSVSHDLRAPLRNVAGFAQLARRKLPPGNPPEILRQLGIVEAEALRLSSLIDELLEFSRLGRRELRRERVDLNALVREVRGNELRADLEGRGIAWELGELPAVPGDPTLLRQVVFNLLANAVKFTRQRPDAAITIAPLPGGTHGTAGFVVRDNGAGFDPRYADKLFGVFQRLHSAREFEGTGIGLATVHRIVHRHGGTIRAEGKPGAGATFTVTLPSG